MPFSLPAGSGGAAAEYRIARSLRFDPASNTHLHRTPLSSSNRDLMTIFFMCKRCDFGLHQIFEAAQDVNNRTSISFDDNDKLNMQDVVGSALIRQRISTAAFRDPSAWYAFTIQMGTVGNVYRVWVWDTELTWSTTTNPASGTDHYFNHTVLHYIGRRIDGVNDFDGYLSHFHLIDGLALDYSAFLAQDGTTGVWGPKLYTGAYGTNGFKLDFADNSAVTAATLGKDTSGNGHNFTPVNFSVTAGVGNDSLVDTPTNYGTDTGLGGEVRGNYCTLNPIDTSSSTLCTITDGALTFTSVSSPTHGQSRGTIWVNSGKWYWECRATWGSPALPHIGISGPLTALADSTASRYVGLAADGYGIQLSSGFKFNNAVSVAYSASFASGDIVGVALDMDAGTITIYKNGVSQGVMYSGLSGTFAPSVSGRTNTGSSCVITLNTGQRPFSYAAPSGFKALCTQNLPTPAIKKSSQYFGIALYTGNDVASRAMTGILEFQGDFWWSKSRNLAQNNAIIDSSRGTNWLATNTTAVENGAGDQAFLSTGLRVTKLDLGVPVDMWNDTGNNYVAWVWKKGVVPGLDVVTFTAPASGNFTVAHNLGVKPAMVIVKTRGASSNWPVWHQSYADQINNYVLLNVNDALASLANIWGAGMTSVNLGFLSNAAVVASQTCVAYVFAEIPGFSKFGSYTGNGSADGPFVWCGFRPRWILLRRTNATSGWVLYDTARDAYNLAATSLSPASANAEAAAAGGVDFLANGFKLRVATAPYNNSGDTHIWAAFAEHPFKYSRAR